MCVNSFKISHFLHVDAFKLHKWFCAPYSFFSTLRFLWSTHSAEFKSNVLPLLVASYFLGGILCHIYSSVSLLMDANFPQLSIVSRGLPWTFLWVSPDGPVWEFLWNSNWRMDYLITAQLASQFHQILPACPAVAPLLGSQPLTFYNVPLLCPHEPLWQGQARLGTQDLVGKSESRSWDCVFTKTLWDIFISAKTVIIKTMYLGRRASMIFYKLRAIIDTFMSRSKRSKGLICRKKKLPRKHGAYSLIRPMLWTWVTQDHAIWDFFQLEK